jgi:hyperosmotically inducible periplasmic protein
MMKTIHPLLALLAAASALLVTRAPLRASEELDDRIESSLRQSHVFKTCLKDDSVRIESRSGAVTLTGTVAQDSHKSLAQDTVESLPGVTSVDNQLKVKGESPVEYSDGWLSAKVKNTLRYHRNLSVTGTDVNVKDGIVILHGEAPSEAQKELTGEYARDVEGVTDVKNEMTIAQTPVQPGETKAETIDDASITAQVKASLLSHRSTSVLKPKVSTTDGVVTVSGIAKNAAEKSLVTRLVTDINGVNGVINEMTFEAAESNSHTPARPAPPQNLRIVSQ